MQKPRSPAFETNGLAGVRTSCHIPRWQGADGFHDPVAARPACV